MKTFFILHSADWRFPCSLETNHDRRPELYLDKILGSHGNYHHVVIEVMGLAPCGFVGWSWCFGETCCLHLQGLHCHFSPWRWRQHVSTKRQHWPTNPHGTKTQDFNDNTWPQSQKFALDLSPNENGFCKSVIKHGKRMAKTSDWPVISIGVRKTVMLLCLCHWMWTCPCKGLFTLMTLHGTSTYQRRGSNFAASSYYLISIRRQDRQS
jgi:hypothetical protein